MVASDIETDGKHEVYKNNIKLFFTKLLFKYTHKIVVQNKYQMNNLLKSYNSKKIVILKKGINLNNIFKNNLKKYDAIWIGRCIKSKRPDLYLKLTKFNPKNKFLMICSEPTKEKTYFNEIKEKAKNINNLVFFDFVKNNKIFELLSQSKVFILTSEFEGDWPMTVLEATGSMVPILSLYLNYDYLIDKYKGGVFCVGDFDLMDKKFKEIIRDHGILEKMSKNAYNYTKENNDIQKNARKLTEIITKIYE